MRRGWNWNRWCCLEQGKRIVCLFCLCSKMRAFLPLLLVLVHFSFTRTHKLHW
ncbi:Cellulose synthase-6 [Zea mays]|uniref:Cellulose synthase-6 n=1 Tax=Zea mays TaxID=4577 RepID=A0A1D6LAV7_MAIZE|nr:Cellulose synthase-6 [Zea mays]